jgi:RNA polymerase sigma factor (sigma-70 family)
MAGAVRHRGERRAAKPTSPDAVRTDPLVALAEAAAARDPDAAASLVMHVAPAVLKVVRSVVGPGHPDVDDIAQDAVIALLGSLRSFRGDSTVLHYAGRIALYTALASRKKERERTRRIDADPGDDRGPHAALEEPATASPLAEVIASRRRAILLHLLDELPAATAEALAMHFILGYTVEEIARAAQVSDNTVWSRLRLGKQALLRRLERDRKSVELLRGGL